jgi:SAM-dependent methyltransferase
MVAARKNGMAGEDRTMRDERSSSRLALNDMAMGFFRGKVLCAAIRLGIADALARGSMTADELAVATKTNAGALCRLMRALASMGVVEEIAPARFELTEFGGPLCRDASDSVWASMIFWADLLADSWTYLPDCVRAGDRSGAEAARVRDGSTSRWSREPEARAIFHAVFAEPTAEDFAAYVAAWDFSRCRVMADLGGGGGGLLCALLAAQPAARGVLVEQQAAIDRASNRFEASGLAARCTLVAGDLLESLLPAADVYLMRCVLHGYDDDSSRKILRNVRRVMEPQGRLLVIEVVLPNQVDRPDPEIEKLLMSDLNMLAVTGGRERSEDEWNALLASAGFMQCRIVRVPGQTTSMIETTRVD